MSARRSHAESRYLRRLLAATAAYLITLFLTLHVLHHGRAPLPVALGLALLPSIPIVAIIWVNALYLKEEKDEFQRELFVQSLLWGAGVTLALTSFWSFIHLMARFPPVDGFHVFLIFWLTVAVSSFFLRRHYGGSDE